MRVFLCWLFLVIFGVHLSALNAAQINTGSQERYSSGSIAQDLTVDKKSNRSTQHHDIDNFSPKWTTWSHCSNHCKQVREKYCINPSKCDGHILKEERQCSSTAKCRSRSTPTRLRTLRFPTPLNQSRTSGSAADLRTVILPSVDQQRLPAGYVLAISAKQPATNHTRKHRPRPAHNPLDPNNTNSPQYTNRSHPHRSSSSSTTSGGNNAYSNFSGVAPSYQQGHTTTGNHRNQLNNDLHVRHPAPPAPYTAKIRVVKMSTADDKRQQVSVVRPRNLFYTKWGSWSKCTHACITQRFRHCKKRGTCKKNVIRETAYCYVEGSPCQRWIQNRMGLNDEDSDEDGDIFIDKIEYLDDEFEKKIRGSCGISFQKKGTSQFYSWPMLRIIGGHISSKEKWPWQVAVLNKYKETFCGGTLISPQWILTAAHCIRKRLYVRINEHDISYSDGTELEYRIHKMIAHKSYDSETVDNDIALLKLPVEVKQNYVCLPRQNQSLPVGTMCTITGWGKRHVKDEYGTKLLHETQVPIVPKSACRSVYKTFHITSNMFCAGFKNGGHDTCAGDSGGPLLCQTKAPIIDEIVPWVLHGVTSFGEGCGRKSKYGIYTAVDNYVKWILETIKSN